MDPITLTNGRQVKLGRKAPHRRKKVLDLSDYYAAERDAQPPPAKVDYHSKAMASLSRMYANDQYGCCVISSAYHQAGVWSANDDTSGAQEPVVATDREVVESYHRICGPGDNGCVITDVLDYTREHGLPMNGNPHKIDGYVSIDHTNKLMVQVALDLFGSLKLGVNLPKAWTCTNCTWAPTNSRIVGGHDVPAVGYDETGVQISTWGGIATITWDAFLSTRWIEECYVVLAPDWYGSDKLTTNGLDVERLRSDLAKLNQGGIPDVPGPNPTPPPPPPPNPPMPPGNGIVVHFDDDVASGEYLLVAGAHMQQLRQLGIPLGKLIQIALLVYTTFQSGPITPQKLLDLLAQIQAILAAP